MKRTILYSLVSLILVTILLFRFFVHVNISPHNSYHLNETEKILIENATSQLKERIENGKFDEIGKDLSKGRQDAYWENIILTDIQNDYVEYGKPLSWKIFQVGQPQLDKGWGGKVYNVECLTKFEVGEFYESFGWLIKENNEIHLIHTDIELLQATEWRIEERNKQNLIVEKYPNDIIIPYTDRYIEIRY